MKATVDKLLTYALTPASWAYGAAVYLRNKMFDKNILLKSHEFNLPVVSIGNITMGGTGKTPHVEYIISHLLGRYKIAVLSRGYKRNTRGFVLANSKSTPYSIGDEAYQVYQKFGNQIKVAVCEKRVDGIKKLTKLYPDLNLILLDDAFQHRYVKPKVSILLIDYNRPVTEDNLLPLGRLRESIHSLNRADIVIVTKCPEDLQPIKYRILFKELNLLAYQKLFFSRFEYGKLLPVFPDDSPYEVSLFNLTQKDSALLLTGIASPRIFVRHFKNYPFKKKICHFSDHHDFSRADVERIEKEFNKLSGLHKIIITTEKDAVRLSFNPYISEELKKMIFYLPIKVRIDNNLTNENFIDELEREMLRRPIDNNH